MHRAVLLALLPLLLPAQSPDPALVEVQANVAADRLSEAETAVRQYLVSHRDSADAHYLLAYILFRQSNPKPSLAEYTEAAQYRPPGALDLEVMGIDYFLLEDFAESD